MRLWIVLAAVGAADAYLGGPALVPLAPRQRLSSSAQKHGLHAGIPGRRQGVGARGLKAILREPQPPNDKFLNAIDKLGRRVTTADVAAATGLSISDAQTQLSTLAQLTSGNLEVSNEGTIVYSFDQGYKGTLAARSGRRRLVEAWNKVAPAAFYITRVSFGIALIASIALVFTAIVALQSSSSRDDRDDRRDYGGGRGFNMYFGPSFWWGPSPFDFLFYNPYQPYGPNRYKDPSELSFLESVFSFLFGDGDPNSDLDERRYQQVAQMIRENNGAVTAEQLAPYMDPDRAYERGDSAMPDESFLLPAVTQLQGRPEITEDGDIVYVFDDLQETAAGGGGSLEGRSARELKALAQMEGISTTGMYDKDDLVIGLQAALAARRRSGGGARRAQALRPYLEEQEYEFSLATGGQKLMVGALGALNLFGALYLGNLLGSPYIAGRELVGLLGFVQTIYPALVAYALAFVAVPTARWFKVKADNAAIEKRNRMRASWAFALQKGGESVQRKLRGAQQLAQGVRFIGKKDIDYSTAESAEEAELKMWDKKFGPASDDK
mmetsp:Transcript_37724/g.92716  ORF Transcript_37724/g.92716 Transcript_37724/m.92716 type:complete len:552 (+) Transcript_37724:30-1685(+)